MMGKTQKIEVDEATAATLKTRAAEHGLSVSELVAEMTALQDAVVVLSAEDIGELDRQWAAIKAGESTVPHEDVTRWLQTWGTPGFKPWHDR
jgi:predicted transcriptional regulator